MLLSALASNKITTNDVAFKLEKRLRQLGNAVQSNAKYGTNNKADAITFYSIKYLKPLITTYEEEDYKCYLKITNKQELINRIYNLVSK